MKKIILKPQKEEFVRRFHPWIFSGAIHQKPNDIKDGDWVEVFAHNGELLASGHYQDNSIAIRILAFGEVLDTSVFWIDKLQKAYQYRKQLGLAISATTTCYRLIHAEGDNLPGLIIDMYHKTAVVQCHSIGMHRDLPWIQQALLKVFGEELEAIYDKSSETLPDEYAISIQNRYLYQQSAPQIALENGYRFWIDWELGQKTGFFIDQRENRKLLAQYAMDKTVLNAFCYSGGFSVYALNAGATSVHSVDVSKKAIEWTEHNVALNGGSERHQSFTEDVLSYLKTCNTYEIVVIDPPAFAKNIKKLHNAVQGYKRLNKLAMEKVAPNGLLFTFSCSQVVDRQLFEDTVTAAALEVGRSVRVLHYLSQPPDHPINLFHPESAYLKGLVVHVE
jgi:23S rRNA (cytosine1962-C5)-methyltransferase